jgi:hypothetical protein
MTFYVVIDLLLIAIIRGVIIDTFEDLHHKSDSIIEMSEKLCPFCSDTRSAFEKSNPIHITWSDHLIKDHNIFDFIIFLILIEAKHINDCDSIERYVKRLLEERDFDQMRGLFKMIRHTKTSETDDFDEDL